MTHPPSPQAQRERPRDRLVEVRTGHCASSAALPIDGRAQAAAQLTVATGGGEGGGLVKPHALDPYPRNRLEVVRGFVGKKVTVSTRDFHYAVGWLRELADDGGEAGETLILMVKDQEVRLARAALVSIQEADSALAEYVK